MNVSGIYKIQSKVKPEKFYIGSAVYIINRWCDHKRTLKLNTHANNRLQNHYNKYGKNDLIFTVIEPCFIPFLIIREQFYIDTLKPWFNICQKAGNCLGNKMSLASRRKIGAASKGRIPSLETRAKMSLKSKGRKHRAESCKKISLLKQNQSAETRKKNSDALKRVWEKRRAMGTMKEIGQLMSNGRELKRQQRIKESHSMGGVFR